MSSTQEVGEIFGEGKGPAQAMLRSPTVLIVSVGLWGMNIFFFRLFGLNYQYILNYDLMKEREEESRNDPQKEAKESGTSDDDDEDGGDVVEDGAAITWGRLVSFSLVLLIMLHFTTHFWIDHLHRGSIGAVFSFYAVTFFYVFLPIPSNRWLRRSFVIVLQRMFELVNPRCSCVSHDPSGPRPIPFVDVFFADAMCSLSKVFFDWGMLSHAIAHYPDPVPPSAHNIIIPSACAAVPYVVRARQCLIMHTVGRIKNDPKRYQHMLNALKYSTSIFPLCLSAYQKTIDPNQARNLEGILIFLLVVNALYALYWDIVMDWGMMQSPSVALQSVCGGGAHLSDSSSGPPASLHACLRPKLRFGFSLSILILITDCVLRFSWTLRFVDWFPDNDSFVLVTQFLEVFRRALWNLLRVEWENLKQRKMKLALYQNSSEELKPLTEIELDRPPASNGLFRSSKLAVA